MPKERFVSYPHCERDGDPSLVVGWAGWDHLQQATALAAYYDRMKTREGWPPDRLVPLLAGLDQLVPWLAQWHNEVDPEYDLRMGDYYRDFVRDEAQALGLTLEAVRAWQPPAKAKGGEGTSCTILSLMEHRVCQPGTSPRCSRPIERRRRRDGRRPLGRPASCAAEPLRRVNGAHVASNLPPKVVASALNAYLQLRPDELLLAIFDPTDGRRGHGSFALTTRRFGWWNRRGLPGRRGLRRRTRR